MKRCIFRLSVVLIGMSLLAMAGFAQDFQKSYRLAQGSRVSVSNISGDVNVQSYDGDSIVVTGYKEGRDREQISIEDRSDDRSVNVRVRYPERCNCDASVRFEVKVPRSINYEYDAFSSVSGEVKVNGARGNLRAKSVSGNVQVSDVAGHIQANSVSGEVSVEKAAGTVTAKSTSGNVKVDLLQLSGETNRMDFGSVSGNVIVSMPGGLGADVQMSTLSGGLETDFPITIEKKEYGPGRSARGRVGDGSRMLKLSSVSGDVKLRRN